MGKKIIFISLFLILISGWINKNLFANSQTYFPLKVGCQWTYIVIKGQEIKEEKLKIINKNYSGYYIFSSNAPYSYVKNVNNQIFQNIGGIDYLLFKLETEVGDSWTSIPNTKGEIIEKQVEVKTSFKTFNNCIKIKLTSNSKITYFWFAEECGLIKQEIFWNGELIERKELKEWTSASIYNNSWGLIKLMFQK